MVKLLATKVNSPQTTGHRDYIIEGKIRDDDGQIKTLTYYEVAGDRSRWGSEYYSGRNYVVGSTSPSYSRNYTGWKGLPARYLPIVKRLKVIHTGYYNPPKRRFAGRR